MKKTLSIILAVLMLLTLCPVAFAEEADYEITMSDPTIGIAIPEADSNDESGVWVKIVPEESGVYALSSDADSELYDTCCSAYEIDRYHYIDFNDDGETDLNFCLIIEMTAGRVYYFHVEELNMSAVTCNITLELVCSGHESEAVTCMGHVCANCGLYYGEAVADAHRWDLGFCVDCETAHEDHEMDGDVCTVCGFSEYAITTDAPLAITVPYDHSAWIRFTPAISGSYVLTSIAGADNDPYCDLYGADKEIYYTTNDDIGNVFEDGEVSEYNFNFCLKYNFSAGETYYFKVLDFAADEDSTFTVQLELLCTDHTGGTQTCIGYLCEKCDVYYGEADENAHDYDDSGCCLICYTEHDPHDFTGGVCSCGLPCPHIFVENDVCLLCGTDFGDGDDVGGGDDAAECDHMCHSDNWFYQLFWNIIGFFQRLFGTEQYCACGAMHYEKPLFAF